MPLVSKPHLTTVAFGFCSSSISRWVSLALTFLAATAHAQSEPQIVRIENVALIASFDLASHRFELKDRAAQGTVVGQLLDRPVADAQTHSVSDPIFGDGQQIRVNYHNGSHSALELYPGLPFLLIRTALRNSDQAEADFRSVIPVQFSVDLGKPVATLRAMGTAGLTALDANPGSYLFLTVADPSSRHGAVTGWLTQDKGSGVLFSSIKQDRIALRAQIDHGHRLVAPAALCPLETLAIGIFEDARLGQEEYADAVAKQYAIRLHPQPTGYCTWYSDVHGGAADESSIVELAHWAAKELKPFGFSFIQIDDKWQDGQERNGPARRFYRVKPDGPYAHGVRGVSEKLARLGLTTGLWFLPFAGDHLDPEFKDRQHWFLKRQDGKPYETAWGNTSFDLSQPEVRTYLADMVRTIHSWGVNYFKMDGLWTGTGTAQIYVNDGYHDDAMGDNAAFHDSKKTNIEIMRDGLKSLRDAAGPDVFFSGCNLSQNMRSLAGSIGLVDAMRIGPDNGQRWRDYREEISKNESGSLVTGPVRGTRLYFLHGRFWWNDPDPCYVRSSIPLHQAQLLTTWVALSGQVYLNSDWLPSLPPDRVELLKRTMPAHRATARPVDYFENVMPSIWLVTQTPAGESRRDVIGIFNWESSNQRIAVKTARAGLPSAHCYYAFDFWNAQPLPSFTDEIECEIPAQSCRVVAVRADQGRPVLVSTSRHVTQGMTELTGESWDRGTGTLSGTSDVVEGDPYQLRIAGLAPPGVERWKLLSATVSAVDREAGVEATVAPVRADEPGWIRVNLRSPQSRAVKWSVQFTKD